MPVIRRCCGNLRMTGIAMSLLLLSPVNGKAQERESFFNDGEKGLAGSHFTWGAELGTSIDVS
ncbi:MAG: hypothetical protein K2H49_04255, partial [Muribaculaceae bacterium]|nr:hypothetical protein [Muribaculaceae bacterium]